MWNPHAWLFPLALLLPLAACTSAPEEAAAAEAVPFGHWTLVELDGQAVVPDAEGRAPTLSLAPDGKLAGFAGVNRYSGQADVGRLDDGKFAVGPLIATRMAGSAAAMELESRFLAALAAADRLQVDAQRLRLSKGDSMLARFMR